MEKIFSIYPKIRYNKIMKKKIDVKIIGYDDFGRGISKEEGLVCFVPKTKIGYQGSCEVVKEKKNFLEGRVDLEDAPLTDCPFFFFCGGCALRHLSRQEQLDFKVKKVENLLSKNAHIQLSSPLQITSVSSTYYRNKATFHIRSHQVGYYKESTHELLPIDHCLLILEKMNDALQNLWTFAKENDGEFEVMIRCFGEKIMGVIQSKNARKPDFSSLFSLDSLYYQDQKIKGDSYLEVSVLNVRFQVSYKSFFQVNLEGMTVLYQKVISYLKETKAENVLDLYCGVGSISLIISKVVQKVYGVEVIKEAVLNANKNKEINHINNVEFACGKVEDLFSQLPSGYDTVILDPPRRGLDSKTRSFLLKSSFKNIIYISCDPATLTRDISFLKEKYVLKKIELIDLFPNTYHVESICLFSEKEEFGES